MGTPRSFFAATFLLLSSWAGAQTDAPAERQAAPASTGAATPATEDGAIPEFYVVKAGESLSRIARRYGLDYRQLAEWNGISDPSQIRVGQRLRMIPPEAGAPSHAKPTATTKAARAVPTPPAGAGKAPPTTPSAASAMATAPSTQDMEQLRATTFNLIQILLEEGLITQEKAAQLAKQANLGELPPVVREAASPAAETAAAEETAEGRKARRRAKLAAAAGAPAAEPGVVRVPYVPEVVKNEIRDQVREEVIAQAKAERWAEPASLPEWLDRITLFGDLRLRYQGNYFSSGNVPALTYNSITGENLDNTTQDEQLFRYQARLGLLAKVSETVGAGLRITTGNQLNPVSTNQSLGLYFNRSVITLDQAYLRWDPSERWTVLGGRMPNPYFTTNLVWDEDVNFDGAAGTFRPRFSSSVGGFFTVGGYLIQNEGSTPQVPDPQPKYLFGLQGGVNWDLSSQAKLRAGLAYYGYQNTWGIRNPTLGSQIYDWTVPLFKQNGNTLFNIDNDSDPSTSLFALAAKFQVIDLTAEVDLLHFDPFVVRLVGDVAKNIGFDQSEIQSRTGLTLDNETVAYKLGVLVGKDALRAFGDWQAFFSYRYLPANAVFDAFNDSDFHLGGTNAKGYEIGGSLALNRNIWMRARWLSADEVEGPPLAIDVLQIDLNAKF